MRLSPLRNLGALALLTGAALAAACTGVIGDGGGSGGASEPPAAGTRPAGVPGAGIASCAATPSPGPAPLRRLTIAEYNHTVRDLLGDKTAPATAFPPDTTAGVFSNSATSLTVSPLLAQGYQQAAEALAATAIATPAKLVACDPKTGDDACATAFIASFGRRAFRRPVTPDESTALLALYADVRTGGVFLDGIQAVIEAVLQSASFLYRPELGVGDPATNGVVPLAPYETASRLSYLLWGSMPDDVLLDAAGAGQLATPAQIEAQARRLLADPRAKDATREFFEQWLHLRGLDGASKDPTLYPGFDDVTRASMFAESRAFFDWVMWQADGRVETLLTAPTSFLDANTAKLYGVTLSGGGTGPQLTALDPTKRAGILTQPSLLSTLAKPNQSSPILRGKFVRERFLCQDLPPPPPNLVIVPPKVAPGATTRERFAQHDKDPACSGCHSLMDPIGFGFEHYDAVGAYRTTDNGLPVDATGWFPGGALDVNGPFKDAIDLGNRLAASA